MKKISIILSSLLILLWSCNNSNNKNNTEQQEVQKVLRLNIASPIKTLFPPAINDVYSMQISQQIFEGLVKYNTSNLRVEPAIAKTWEISDDKTEYTFYLNDDVYFHDNACFKDGKGRKLTAKDVEYSLYQLCSQQHTNYNFQAVMFRVLGARKYYEASKNGTPDFDIPGIKVINDFKITIKLEKPMPYFLNALAMPYSAVYPKEAFEKYGERNYVGTGAFYLNNYPDSEHIVLIKNKDYYMNDKNNVKLPYLDSVVVNVETSIQKELQMFVNDKIDAILNIPESYISEFMDLHIKDFESKPPKYVVTSFNNDNNNEMFNLMKANLKNLFTNSMNYLDFSVVYFEQQKNVEPEKNDSLKTK